MFCQHCGASNQSEHEALWSETSFDLSILLRMKEFGYSDRVDKIVESWRTHSLSSCDPLALD